MSDLPDSTAAKREQLRAHFDELESRLDPRKAAERYVGKIQDSYNENPTPWLAGAAAAALATVGGIALAIFGRR